MNLRKCIVVLALAGFASGAAQADIWTGDFNTGSANDGVIVNFNGFEVYAQGSAAFFLGATQLDPGGTTLLSGDVVTTRYQGVVSGFSNSGSDISNLLTPIDAVGSYQLTVAAQFDELVTFAGPIGANQNLAVLQPLPGGRVSLFFDDGSLAGTFITSTPGILAGTGYTDGLMVADGVLGANPVNTFGVCTAATCGGPGGSGFASVGGPLLTALLGSLPDGIGFLPDVPGGFTASTLLQYGTISGTAIATDYRTQNFFDNANGWNSLGVNSLLTLRADANVDLSTTAVPEPATLALLGIALVGLGIGRRRGTAASA